VTIALYMDHHVPQAVTDGLRRRGVDVLTASEDGHESVPDQVLLTRATVVQRILYTHDEDFLAIAWQWQRSGRPFPGIVYLGRKSVSSGQPIDDLELIAKAWDPEEMRNKVQYIPL